MSWRVNAKRNLPIRKQSSWPSNAKSRILKQFAKDGGGYKAAAKGAFLLYRPPGNTQADYKLPFAVVSGGKVVAASSSGLAAAARRLPQVKGVPSGVTTAARRVIDSYQKKMKETEVDSMPDLSELNMDVSSFSSLVRRSFHQRFRIKSDIYDSEEGGYMYVEDVFWDHPQLGTSVVVSKSGSLWQVSYSEDDEGNIVFDAPAKWIKVYRTYVPANADSATSSSTSESAKEGLEHAGGVETDDEVAEFGEADSGVIVNLVEESGDGPLQLDVAIIEPGWGNKRDNNYYPADVLKRDAGKFAGAKMYASNHREHEKSVLTEVSQVLKCPVGFTDTGAPIARVGIFDASFAESIRNREKLGVLDSLHVSILAAGQIQRGFKEGDRKGNRVVEITQAASVDWVTKAGAGGRALTLAEASEEVLMDEKHEDVLDMDELEEAELSEEDQTSGDEGEAGTEPETEPEGDEGATEPDDVDEPEEDEETVEEFLSETEVRDIIGQVKGLPDATVERLYEGNYHNRYEVISAIQAEKDYLTLITESGKPPKFGESGEEPAPLSEEDVRARKTKVNKKFLPSHR